MPLHLTVHAHHTNRLSFGVPLEDVFPPGNIHPGLTQNILIASYRSIAENHYRVEEVLNRFQGSLEERLKLKERLVISKEFEGLNVLPGALLWVARHFIGLLPVPLMPQYSNGQKYAWQDISKKCTISLTNYVTRGRNNRKLVKKLADELVRLPPPNFLLVATLLDLLRMLAVLPAGEPKINKTSVFALVKYFSSSLFLRPFRPGWVTKTDKQYYPLLLYLILKWPEIHRICIETSKHYFSLPFDEIFAGYYKKGPPSEHPFYIPKRTRDNSSQTAAQVYRKSHERETLIRIVPPSYNDFSFLRDVACQTENFENYSNSRCEKLSTREALVLKERKDEKSNEIKTRVIVIPKGCCCTYSTNYETNSEPKENQRRRFATENGSDFQQQPTYKSDFKNVRPKTYGWNLNDIFDTNRSNESGDTDSLILSSTSEFINTANYIYDDYSKCNLICDTGDSTYSYEDVKTFDPVEKEEKHLLNEALKEKISQIGWAYTSPNEYKITSSENGDRTSLVGCRTPQQDPYDVHKSLNEELKDKLNELQIRQKCDREIDTNYENTTNFSQNLARSISQLNLPETESKKSLINVDKIKSKLEFLRIFNARKGKAKKSFSCEQVGSKVKYEKMGSASSIL